MMNQFPTSSTARACALAIAATMTILPCLALAQDRKPDDAPPPSVAADPGVWSLSSGVSYSRGDYGDVADTKVLAAPVSVKYRKGSWRFKVSLPFVRVTGPGSLLQTPEGRDSGSGGDFVGLSSTSGSGGTSGTSGSSGSGTSGSGSSGSGSSGSGSGGSGSSGSGSSGSGSGSSGSGATGAGSSGTSTAGGVVAPGSGLVDNRRSGIGDLTMAATYSFDLGNAFYADVTGKLKLPTASRTKRLGTGKIDVTTSLDLIKDVGPASFYVSGRRKFAGKPAGSSLRSVWGAGGGASVLVAPGVSVGADYDWQQASFKGGQASSEVTGWTYFRLNRAIGMTLYAGTGLNTASADFLGGATLTVRF